MLRNYVITALRNLVRNRLYAAIIVIGMSAGLAAALLIGLLIRDDFSYDMWIPGHENIYRVSAGTSGKRTTSAAPSDLGQWLKLEFPQIEAITRLYRDAAGVSVNDLEFTESVDWADANFFDVIRLPAIAGNLATALSRPDSVVLTRRLALKYFRRADAVGETVMFDRLHPMKVTAVIEDLPSNTQFMGLGVIAAAQTVFSPATENDRMPLTAFGQKLWHSQTFFRLAAGADVETIRAAMPDILDRRSAEPKERAQKPSEVNAITITPLADVHMSDGMSPHPRAEYGNTYASIALGLLISFAAGINFVNLMTARAARRALEVGVRKVNGAQRRHLMIQFLGEALVYVLISTAIASAVVALSLAPLDTVLRKTIELSTLWTDPTLLFGAVSFVALTAILAGLYPSLVLSAFVPAQVLRASATGPGRNPARQFLVIMQFAILIGLMVFTTVFYRQAHFGIRESLRQITNPILLIQSSCADAFRDAIAALPGVEAASCSTKIPQLGMGNSSEARYEGRTVEVHYTSIDAGQLEQFGLKPIAGRFFARERVRDSVPDDRTRSASEAVIINQKAARALGFDSPEAAVGQAIAWSHIDRFPSTFTPVHPAEIVGVVEDFQMGGIGNDIPPAAFYMDPRQWGTLSVTLSSQQIPETLTAIRDVWKRLGDTKPLDTRFYEHAVQDIYVGLIGQAAIFGFFAAVALFIAVLGLIGLAAFTAERRTKEIGIRKSMGATRGDILRLVLWQFTKPVLWANVIAWPVAYFMMRSWLEDFPRHIDLTPWMFLAASALALGIAVLTVIGHALLVARAKPVAALRYE